MACGALANYLRCGHDLPPRTTPCWRERLYPGDIKNRLLATGAESWFRRFIWAHAKPADPGNDSTLIYLSGPGHGAPGVLGPNHLPSTASYSEIYPDKSPGRPEGIAQAFSSSFLPSRPHRQGHCTPGNARLLDHEGGETRLRAPHACGRRR